MEQPPINHHPIRENATPEERITDLEREVEVLRNDFQYLSDLFSQLTIATQNQVDDLASMVKSRPVEIASNVEKPLDIIKKDLETA